MAKTDINLDGQKFGRWTVLKTIPRYKNGKTYCLCRCECGTERYVVRSALLDGSSQSCGCLAKELMQNKLRKDYIGQTFGELTVLEMLYGYKNKKTYCRCLCSCGKECIVQMNNLTKGYTKSCGCRQGEFVWNARGRTNLKGLVFGRLTVVEMLYNYNNTKRTYCRCICSCGNETIVDMGNLLSGRTSSCGCWEKESRHNRRHYKDIIGQQFGLLTVTRKAGKDSAGNIMWECLCECGNTVYVSYSDLRRYRKTSCGCSHYSNMENFIASILSKHKIKYIPQAKFQECRNIHPLKFDFYLYEYNTIIEYDGEQHDKPIKFFGGEEAFAKRIKNDNIKNCYCKENDINLIRLSYTLTTQEIEDEIIHIWNP